jgi:ATP/maltotriose-dependent transcriptional regulator MalT
VPRFLSTLRSAFGRRQPARPTDTNDTDLERFFTDAEEARKRFEEFVTAPALPRRLLVIHGVGAVGKTSLLKMYRLRCRRSSVPVTLVGGEEAPSVVDLLSRLAADLSGDGLPLPAFQRTLDRYRDVQTKVEMEAHKVGQDHADAADELAKAAAKGLIKVAASFVPGGSLIEAVGSDAAEAVLNLLRAKLDRAEFELFLDPARPLTDDFLADMAEAARSRRAVVMLDTFEQITALGDWVREFVRRMPDNVLVVIAGRELPDWDPAWPGWIARAAIVELREMTDADMEQLVQRYYALFDRGEADAAQVRDVVAFARGLPMAATTAVRLWAAYQQSDLHPVGAGVVADLADRLLQGVPVEMRPAFEAAAVLRTFNADSLGALLGGEGIQAMYEELRRWPFTRDRREGLAVHDTMREVMSDALRARSPAEFRSLNEKAAAYYRSQVERATGDERDRLQLESLYHSTRADEVSGIRLFRDIAEELVRYQLISRLRTLVSDANTYPLMEGNSRLWRRYYGARLEHLEGKTAAAERVYRDVADDGQAEATLRAYALCDIGTNMTAMDRLAEPEGERKARDAVEKSQQIHPELDTKLVANHMSLMHLSNVRGDWDESLRQVGAMHAFADTAGDAFGLVMTDRLTSGIRGLQGDWPSCLEARSRYMQALDRLGDVPALRMHASYLIWPLMFMGRCREAQLSGEDALTIAIRLEEKEVMVAIIEGVALALGLQEKYAEAAQRFAEAMNFYENFYAPRGAEATGASERYIRATLSFRGLVSLREGRFDDAEADLRRALEVKQRIGDRMGVPEINVWSGQLAEARGSWEDAERSYAAALDPRGVRRHYFECAALAGLARVRAVGGRDEECVDPATQAEELARRFRYNDHLAGLRLFQGHLAWDGRVASWTGGEQATERLYRAALVHALRFNRFLLDEVLTGRPQGSVFTALIPHCLERGPDGRRVLASLAAWWRDGTNDIEGAEADVISPIEAGVPLVDAERVARGREPGPGDPQSWVIERIEAAVGG